MLKSLVIRSFRQARSFATITKNLPTAKSLDQKCFSTLINKNIYSLKGDTFRPILSNPKINEIITNFTPSRSVTKFSLKKGKRKSVKVVLVKFFRLNWGGWIRTKAGRHRQLWKKSGERKKRLAQHVFCNSTQSYMLDKMVTNFWKKPKYYVEDPYEPYHSREEFWVTRKKPMVRS